MLLLGFTCSPPSNPAMMMAVEYAAKVLGFATLSKYYMMREVARHLFVLTPEQLQGKEMDVPDPRWGERTPLEMTQAIIEHIPDGVLTCLPFNTAENFQIYHLTLTIEQIQEEEKEKAGLAVFSLEKETELDIIRKMGGKVVHFHLPGHEGALKREPGDIHVYTSEEREVNQAVNRAIFELKLKGKYVSIYIQENNGVTIVTNFHQRFPETAELLAFVSHAKARLGTEVEIVVSENQPRLVAKRTCAEEFQELLKQSGKINQEESILVLKQLMK